jgi:hypothetical protein
MVFFRPQSFRLEVERFDRGHLSLVEESVSTTFITSFTLYVAAVIVLKAAGIQFDLILCLIFTVFGVAGGVVFGVGMGVAGEVAKGVGLGVVVVVAGGVAGGVVFGVAGGVAYLSGHFRLLLIPVESLWTLIALIRAKRNPLNAARLLKQSLAYRDEVMLLPQPFLKSLLVVVGRQDREEMLKAVAHLSSNTFQRRIAVNALLEFIEWHLLQYKTIDEIAGAEKSLGWIAPSQFEVHMAGEIRPKGSLSISVRRRGEEEFEPTGSDEKETDSGEVEASFQSTSEKSPQIIKLDSIPRSERVGTPTIIQSLPSGVMKPLHKSGAIEAIERCRQISIEVAAAVSSTSDYQKQLALNRARRRLDDLTQFAILGLRGRESQTFLRIARQWLDAVNSEIDRLTEEARATGRIDNPYVAPRPLLPGSDVFIGRSNVFRFIEEHFLKPDQNTPVVLHGQPRIGKSSILRHLSSRLQTNLIPVYIDMQRAAQVESTGGLLYNLADAVAIEIKRRDANISAPSLGDYAAEPFIIFGKFLDSAEQVIHAPENRLILALDEFEEIERKLAEGRISPDLLPFLRSMMQHREGISLIFAGTHRLDEMIQEQWMPYFRSTVSCKVSYLSEKDARQLITAPLKGFPLEYEPEALNRLLAMTHCHPCLIQLTCMILVDLKNEQRSRHASVEDVDIAMAKAMESGDYVFRGIWDWIPPDERTVLSALAVAPHADIGDLALAIGAGETQIFSILKRLAEVDVVEAVIEAKNATWRFQVEMFRQWVERYKAREGVDLLQPASRIG